MTVPAPSSDGSPVGCSRNPITRGGAFVPCRRLRRPPPVRRGDRAGDPDSRVHAVPRGHPARANQQVARGAETARDLARSSRVSAGSRSRSRATAPAASRPASSPAISATSRRSSPRSPSAVCRADIPTRCATWGRRSAARPLAPRSSARRTRASTRRVARPPARRARDGLPDRRRALRANPPGGPGALHRGALGRGRPRRWLPGAPQLLLGAGEGAATWGRVFKDLTARGLTGVRCVVSDEHLGLRAALQRYCPAAVHQRCQRHYLRDAFAKVSHPTRQQQLTAGLRDVCAAPMRDEAERRGAAFATALRPILPAIAEWLDTTLGDTLSFYVLAEAEARRWLWTTNALEREHEEVGRRTRVIRIFPTRRVISARLRAHHESQRRVGRSVATSSAPPLATIASVGRTRRRAARSSSHTQ